MKLCPSCSSEITASTWFCPTCGWRAGVSDGITVLTPARSGTADGFDPAQFAVLFELEAGNFWFRARNALILWAIGKFFPAAGRMLEIGCGTGYVLSAIEGARPELELTGSEIYLEGAKLAARRVQRAQIVQMDGRAMPFASEFDLIGAFDVLEHVDDDAAVLREAMRALRPGGGLIMTVPQHPTMWSATDEFAHHQRRYTRVELLSKVKMAGFAVVRCTSFVTLLQPLMLASRRLGRDPAHYDPLAEYRISPWLNHLLEAVMGFERQLIKAGLNLPIGGSLLVVAVKEYRTR